MSDDRMSLVDDVEIVLAKITSLIKAKNIDGLKTLDTFESTNIVDLYWSNPTIKYPAVLIHYKDTSFGYEVVSDMNIDIHCIVKNTRKLKEKNISSRLIAKSVAECLDRQIDGHKYFEVVNITQTKIDKETVSDYKLTIKVRDY